MSDNYTDDDLDLDIEDDSTDIRGLRKAANQAKKLKAEVAQMRRELAFAKAGLPLDDPKMNYFIKGYDGEMDPEVIRETAMQAGFFTVQQPDTAQVQQQATLQAQQASQQRVMSASAGATAEDVSEAAAMARMEAAMQEGGLEAMLDIARQYGIPTSTDI